MHPQEVFYSTPPPIIPQMWDVRTLQGISFFLFFTPPPTNLIQMVDPRLPGVLGLGETACFPGSWGGVPTCPWGTVY